MVRTAVVLVSDSKGIEPLSGIPVAERLVPILAQLGFDEIHVVGRVSSLVHSISDLVPIRCLHPIESGQSLEEIVSRIEILPGEKVLVLKVSQVLDRSTLTRFMAIGADPAACRMQVVGVRGKDGWLCLVDAGNLAPTLQVLWSSTCMKSEELEPAVLKTMKEVHTFNGLPCAVEESETDTMRLDHTKATPKRIRLIRKTIGLTGILLLPLPGYWPKLIGSFLLVSCVIGFCIRKIDRAGKRNKGICQGADNACGRKQTLEGSETGISKCQAVR